MNSVAGHREITPPAVTNVNNVDSASVNGQFEWIRIGDRVAVTGTVSIDATAASQCTIGISLPITSTFTVADDCNGVGASSSGSQGASVVDTANNRASSLQSPAARLLKPMVSASPIA